jgi:hypothetical protein
MKKIMMTLAAIAVAATMNAQAYIGGSLGFATASQDGNSTTVWSIMPEVGYNLNENWAVGTVIGYGEAGKDESKVKKFTIAPYVRYTVAKLDKVNVFIDGTVGYTNTKYYGFKNNTFNVGIKPGVAVNLNDKLSFVTHFGFLGYENSKDDYEGAKAVNTFGLDLNGNNLTFGLYYNF